MVLVLARRGEQGEEEDAGGDEDEECWSDARSKPASAHQPDTLSAAGWREAAASGTATSARGGREWMCAAAVLRLPEAGIPPPPLANWPTGSPRRSPTKRAASVDYFGRKAVDEDSLPLASSRAWRRPFPAASRIDDERCELGNRRMMAAAAGAERRPARCAHHHHRAHADSGLFLRRARWDRPPRVEPHHAIVHRDAAFGSTTCRSDSSVLVATQRCCRITWRDGSRRIAAHRPALGECFGHRPGIAMKVSVSDRRAAACRSPMPSIALRNGPPGETARHGGAPRDSRACAAPRSRRDKRRGPRPRWRCRRP